LIESGYVCAINSGFEALREVQRRAKTVTASTDRYAG
jgi:hypothetical protein